MRIYHVLQFKTSLWSHEIEGTFKQMQIIKKYNAGFIQFDVKPGRVGENLSTVLKHLEALEKLGVKLAVLPEMWSCGFDNENLAYHAGQTPEILKELSIAASEKNMVMIYLYCRRSLLRHS